MPLYFADLLSALPHFYKPPSTNPEISAPVTENAQEIQAGGVFLARKGRTVDGHDYIPQAIARGAVAVVGEYELVEVEHWLDGVAYAQVPDGYQAFGYLVAAYEGHPSQQLVVIGVTGTDGKTTTSSVIYHILKAAGVKVGLINTVQAVIGEQEISTGLHVTTPHAHETQNLMRQMVEAGLTHCILETTSMGLDQGRVNGVQIDVAVLTNVTHEHLDWHGSWEAYRDAKSQLFRMLKEFPRKGTQPKIAVINADDSAAPSFAEASAAGGADYMLLYSISQSEADFFADRIHYAPSHTSFMLRGNAGDMPIRSPLVGPYNVSNVLAGIGGAISAMPQPEYQQLMLNAIPVGISEMPQIPGRMERIDAGQDFLALVDFAHTPNALQKVLEAAHLMKGKEGRVIVAFGSAGLRDKEKRRMMAEIAAQYADISILTAEDPRTESLLGILEEMAEGAVARGGVEYETFFRVPDRGQALYEACQMAKAGDVVLACGKGHEQSMCFGTIEYAWDDREALRHALEGQALATLPSATQPYDERETWREQ